jgi:hypothetical protein
MTAMVFSLLIVLTVVLSTRLAKPVEASGTHQTHARNRATRLMQVDFKPAKPSTMLLLTMHALSTRAMVMRACSYACELAGERDIVFAITYDATSGNLSVLNDLRELLRHNNVESSVIIRTHTERAVLDAYPKLREASARVSDLKRPLLWGFLSEPILMLWGSLPNRIHRHLRWVWVLEADVVWSGPIKRLVAAYALDTSDLISSTECKRIDTTWPHFNAVSSAFDRRWPQDRRWGSRNFVQRASARMLDELTATMDAGAHGWSEQHWCTLAKNTVGMTVRYIDAAHQGAPYSWKDAIVFRTATGDKIVWNRFHNSTHMQSKLGSRGANKIYHPIKF